MFTMKVAPSSFFLAWLAWALMLACNPLLAGETVTVDIKKYKFIPEEITVKVGTTVRWENSEKRQYHSVWFREAGDEDSGYFWPEETFERTFDEPGVFPYVCEPHEKDHDMKGVVRVVP
jgi:plastocyanin